MTDMQKFVMQAQFERDTNLCVIAEALGRHTIWNDELDAIEKDNYDTDDDVMGMTLGRSDWNKLYQDWVSKEDK